MTIVEELAFNSMKTASEKNFGDKFNTSRCVIVKQFNNLNVKREE